MMELKCEVDNTKQSAKERAMKILSLRLDCRKKTVSLLLLATDLESVERIFPCSTSIETREHVRK